MISADRMKSVRMAPVTMCSRRAGTSVATGIGVLVMAAIQPHTFSAPRRPRYVAPEHQDAGQQATARTGLAAARRAVEQELLRRDPMTIRLMPIGSFTLGGRCRRHTRRHRGLVDDHPRGLRRRTRGRRSDVVDRRPPTGRWPQRGRGVQTPGPRSVASPFIALQATVSGSPAVGREELSLTSDAPPNHSSRRHRRRRRRLQLPLARPAAVERRHPGARDVFDGAAGQTIQVAPPSPPSPRRDNVARPPRPTVPPRVGRHRIADAMCREDGHRRDGARELPNPIDAGDQRDRRDHVGALARQASSP